jgi:hypothetical protein
MDAGSNHANVISLRTLYISFPKRRRFSLSRRIYFLAPSPSAPRVSAASA